MESQQEQFKGMNQIHDRKNEIEKFVLNTRLRTVNVPFPRIHHTTTCHQNTLYCFSGLRSLRNSDNRTAQCVRDCHQLHFRKTFPWKKMVDKNADSPSERFLHVMWSRTKTKSLWVAGGLDLDLNAMKDIWCIDNSTNGEWKLVTSNAPINIYASSVLYHKYLDTTLFYGVNGFSRLDFPSPEIDLTSSMQGESLSWIQLDPIPGKYAYRTGHASQWMQKNQMLIFGGESWNTRNGEPQEPPEMFLDAITECTGWLSDIGPDSFRKNRRIYDLKNRVVLNDLWIYNIVTMKWEQLHASTHNSPENNNIVPSPRAHHTSCVVKRNLYIYGGLTIKNGVVSAVEDMDVVWCLDLYKLSKRRESEEDLSYNIWHKIEITADRFLPRNVVGFSLDLIARKDKAVAFIGFGGYDLEQKKVVNRMFTLIDSNYAHIDLYAQSKQARSSDNASYISQDEFSEIQLDSPQDEYDERSQSKETPNSCPPLFERLKSSSSLPNGELKCFEHSEQSYPMQSDPLPFDVWNQNRSYSLFSGDHSNVFRQSVSSIQTPEDEHEDRSSRSFPHYSSTFSERDDFSRREAELTQEIHELREKLVQQQQLYIQESQFRELDFQTRVRSATNMRFKLLASEARDMNTDMILQVKSDLEASLLVVKQTLDQSILCVSCGRNRRSVVFFPCTHVKVCENCSEDAIRCPVCSTLIQSKYRVAL